MVGGIPSMSMPLNVAVETLRATSVRVRKRSLMATTLDTLPKCGE
jgi:hypothetical protein